MAPFAELLLDPGEGDFDRPVALRCGALGGALGGDRPARPLPSSPTPFPLTLPLTMTSFVPTVATILSRRAASRLSSKYTS